MVMIVQVAQVVHLGGEISVELSESRPHSLHVQHQLLGPTLHVRMGGTDSSISCVSHDTRESCGFSLKESAPQMSCESTNE